MQRAKIPPSPEMIATTERLLSDAFGGAIRLAEDEDLTASGRAGVYRLRVLSGPDNAPDSAIVKQARKYPAGTFFNDWASLQFLSQVVPDISFAPRFYAGDVGQGIFVMEDLGKGQRLDHLLLGNDPVAAEAALIEHATLHGRLHALTIGKQAEYAAIRNPLGALVHDYDDPTLAWLAPTLQQSIDLFGVAPARGIDHELAELASAIQNPGPFLAFVQSDACPDNCLYIDSSLYLLDFEGGEYSHALLEGVYGRIHFPTCWCVYRLPEQIPLRMETVYRTELVKGCPAAADDTLFYRAVVEACAYWLLKSYFWIPLSKVLESDRMVIAASDRQRFLTRTDIFVQTSEQFGHLEALGATMRKLAMTMRARWPETEEMACYPAFR
ncbi:MAG: hypothetical protein H0V70_06050 [Ktedonobacteraceae bacterium]|nr:hypothetical protein [Ktedonobacteraceae bacterium]